jgi:hypothetical protein
VHIGSVKSNSSGKGEQVMASNVIFWGWNRAIPGREHIAGEHFQEFVQYLGGLQQNWIFAIIRRGEVHD